jgi:hypothetical protein
VSKMERVDEMAAMSQAYHTQLGMAASSESTVASRRQWGKETTASRFWT